MGNMSEEGIRQHLHTKWAGQNLIYKDVTGSTNDDLKELAAQGAPTGTLVVADQQVQGKGRRGRGWETPAGTNIAMSLMLRPTFSPETARMLTIVMALAIAGGMEEVTGQEAGIKWPNDIVMHGHKLCGILTELHLAGQNQIGDVVIGVGINVNNKEFPEEIRAVAGSLFTETGKEVDRNELVAACMKHFEEAYETFIQTEDLSGLKEAYEKRLLNLNQEVRVLDPKGEFQAVSRGIDDYGELLVETRDGLLTVDSGEVSVRGLYGYAENR